MDSEVYTENLLDHYKNPRNYGNLDKANYKSSEANLVCGDVIEFQLKVKDNIITDVKFKGDGCAISKGCASMLSEKIKNMSINDVKKMTEKDIFSILKIEISEARIKCAMLPLIVIKKALDSPKLFITID